jgi:rare lipoprotein A
MSRLGLLLVGLVTLSLLTYDGICYTNRQEALRESAPYQTGKASWYGKEEQGKLTADGEHFNRREMTAAHRHLPFNTLVRVTNRDNGRSVVVRINDRGPYRGHRILDLSEAAADSLGMKKQGLATVDIEVLPSDSASPLTPSQP